MRLIDLLIKAMACSVCSRWDKPCFMDVIDVHETLKGKTIELRCPYCYRVYHSKISHAVCIRQDKT